MPKIIYIHVPKCGGSSFGAALRLRFFLSQATIRLDRSYPQRQTELHQLITRRIRMIAGHVQYNPHLHAYAAKDYAYVTLLRDPVDRFVSHYNYLQRRHPDDSRAQTLSDFVDTADALRLATQYVFYFSGASDSGGDAVALAIANLRRFALVGNLAEPQSFADGLRELIGTPLPRWTRNAAPTQTLVPKALRPRIEQLCDPDIRIFEAVHGQRQIA